MNSKRMPINEKERLEAVCEVLAVPDLEKELDWVIKIVSLLLNVPTSLVSIVSAHEQKFVAKKGMDVDSTSRDVAFCDHVVAQEKKSTLVVEDALLDHRFRENPLVCFGPKIRAYVGAPIYHKGLCLGTVCAIDYQPRKFSQQQIDLLTQIGNLVTNLILSKIEHKALSVMTQRYEYILDGAGLGSWDWWLADNRVTFDRRWCDMLGLKLEETPMQLSTWDERVHPADRDAAYRDIKKYMDGETSYYENIHRLKHANGQWVWILDRGRISEYDSQGKPIRFTGTHLDITQQKMLESAIEQEREKTFHNMKLASLGQLTSSIGHEINNPLCILQGELFILNKMLEKEKSNNREIEKRIHNMDEMSDRMASIVKNMRKMANKDHELTFHEVDVFEIIEQAIHFMKPLLAVHKVAINFSNESTGPLYVIGIKPILEQVIVNLITNSKEALNGHENGQIQISLRHRVENVEIEIVDNGPGIKNEFKNRIFEPFFTTKGTQGGGLGLSLVYNYVLEHKGQIRFENNQPHGCRFILQLPLLKYKKII